MGAMNRLAQLDSNDVECMGSGGSHGPRRGHRQSGQVAWTESKGHTIDQCLRAAVRELVETADRLDGTCAWAGRYATLRLVSVQVDLGRDHDDWHSGELLCTWEVL